MKEKKNNREVSVQEFIDTLNVFDKDGAGKVSSGELRHVLTALGKYVPYFIRLNAAAFLLNF